MLKFGKPNSDAIKERERINKESKEASDLAIGAAQGCLQHELFKKYCDEYEKLEKLTMDRLINIDRTEEDPIKYGFAVKSIISEYRYIGTLLRGVRQEAGKRK